jgi:hypothetical protein
MAEAGVTMTESCEFNFEQKLDFRVVTRCQASVYVEKLFAEIWPHHNYVAYLVSQLNGDQNSEEILKKLTSALSVFSITVLVNELELLSNFPQWAAEKKWDTLYNVRVAKS